MTVLVTSAAEPGSSGLIMLMHLDAHDKRGGVVSIPPQTLVQVPGHGLKQIDTALGYGGPSLLVKTVEQLTHVQIDHYARIKFTGVSNLVNVIGGVNVTLAKKTVSNGYTFHAGVNHLNGITAVYYVRNPSISPDSRVLQQQNLLRAILDKITNEHLLTNPLTAVHVVQRHGRHADRGQQLHQLRGGESCHPARPRERQRGNLRDGAHVHRFGCRSISTRP